MNWRTGISAALVLLSGSLASPAFNFIYNSTGVIEHWAVTTPDPNVPTNSFDQTTHAIRFYLASDAYSTTNTANELNALRNVFGTWQSVPNTVVKFEDAGLVAPGVDVNTTDKSNVVFWAKSSTIVNGGKSDISGALAVTFTSFSVPGNVIQQFDIAINGVQNSWFTDFNDKSNPSYFVEGPLLHEVGHSLGMNHSSMGGATMFYASGTGVDPVAGLSVDEIAYARTVYPSGNILTTLGNLSGSVTKGGSPVLGAAVVLEGANGVLAGSTVTVANGSYVLNSVPPGSYNVRVAPLDPAGTGRRLISGPDVASAFSGADTSFFPTGNTPVTLTAGTTTTMNFTVTNGTPAFRTTLVRQPTANANSFSISGLPVSIQAGQSNLTIGVFSADLPTSGATFTITGDGLTVGAPTYQPGNVFSGLNGISASISVASNATPGLRTLIVQQGGNISYANGFLDILPTVPDFNFDGLDDRFQRKYFFPFTSSNAAPAADPDHDGFNNTAEFVAGSDPTNPASFLKLLSIMYSKNGATITWASGAGSRYQLLTRTSAVSGTWLPVGSVVTAVGSTTSELDPSATNGIHFYRIEALP